MSKKETDSNEDELSLAKTTILTDTVITDAENQKINKSKGELLLPDNVLIERFKLIDEIYNSEVFSIWRAKDTLINQIVILKVLTYDGKTKHKQFFENAFLNEGKITFQLIHTNILKPHSIYKIEHLDSSSIFFNVAPYLPNGNLKQLMRRGPLNEEQITNIFKQISSALSYLHANNLVHQDIKASNILITHDKKYLLSDFTFCNYVRTNENPGIRALTYTNTAPERYNKHIEIISTESDIFSLGTLIYEVAYGKKLPWKTTKEFLNRNFRLPELPNHFSTGLIKLIHKCLAVLPEERPTAHELVDYLNNLESMQDEHNPNVLDIDSIEDKIDEKTMFIVDGELEEPTNLYNTDIDKRTIGNDVYISYAWGNESEEIAISIENHLKSLGLNIIRDKNHLKYKGNIEEFMQEIGQGDSIIIVISDKYLKSENCMFELVEIANNKNFYHRIFPIVLSDAEIYKPIERVKYIKYWENQIETFDRELKTLRGNALQELQNERNNYERIRNSFDSLIYIIKNINCLTPEMHESKNFEPIYKSILGIN